MIAQEGAQPYTNETNISLKMNIHSLKFAIVHFRWNI